MNDDHDRETDAGLERRKMLLGCTVLAAASVRKTTKCIGRWRLTARG